MSPLPFSFTRSDDGTETIVLLGEAGVRVLPQTHVNYDQIRETLLDGVDEADADRVYALADAASEVENTLRRLSDRVTLRRDSIYFDGDKMESRLTRHIVDMIHSGDENWGGYVKFLENVQANPSKSSRKSLFKFLDKHDLVITDDGHFIGYKGVQDNEDNLSVTSGKEPVTVTLENGDVEEHTGYIPNPVGATVEMPRSLVDDNREQACSVGLHVGTHEYANGFGRKLLTVKVNPRDVVSVPSDSDDSKIRTCRYTVLEVNDGRRRYEGTSWTESDLDLELADDETEDDGDGEEACVCCGEEADLDENGLCENCQGCD
jgi:hypothetical protein